MECKRKSSSLLIVRKGKAVKKEAQIIKSTPENITAAKEIRVSADFLCVRPIKPALCKA